ncbi:Hpt domain-containing protein [Aestuariibacter sp. A3R04]|uniref:Hpt domain-containing protein n=1 Tax=Aestuariibacter sp. A3R04 TaxID=2841571 RepID=UPI001C086BE7|nr:Hpt domain-containing protein [Aestuariibacter sp. A3R04]MBU3024010.1 Hpt domain-containing protein [Aestuariibacter sp. A3R04]
MNTTLTLDKKSALKRLMNNENLYDKLVILFSEQVEDIRRTLQNYRDMDTDSLRFALHTLKGSAGEIGAEALRVELARVETIVKMTPDSISDKDIHAVEHEISLLMGELALHYR